MKTVLITGGCGFIGSHLTLYLKKRGYRVIVIDNLSIGRKLLFRGNKFYKLDINNKKKLNSIFEKYNFEAVFHLAGLSKLTDSFKKKNSYKKNNITSTKILIDLVKRNNVKYFIFSSSASVYGKQKKFPIKENAKTSPISYYGKTKLICENIIKKNCSNNSLKAISLRYFNVIGSNFKNKLGEIHNPPIHLIPIFVKNILKDKPVKLRLNFNTKDKSGVRDYIDVGDIVKAHYFSLQKLKETKKSFYIINLGSKTFYSAKQILELIRKFLEIKKVRIVYSVKKKGEPDKLLASSQLASSFLKWKPKIKISESLKNMILWEKYKIKQKKLFYK
ncbi:MAG: UDP-glucose 4-epimerase GalE [Candidatus Pelagibacter sp. TMED166]|nr:MAG: UDP-glucose 4-epimerase GalE [Candidatus Pelagibacter sp. TMED166]